MAAVHILTLALIAKLTTGAPAATAATRDPIDERLLDPQRGGIDGGGDGQRREEQSEGRDDPYGKEEAPFEIQSTTK